MAAGYREGAREDAAGKVPSFRYDEPVKTNEGEDRIGEAGGEDHVYLPHVVRREGGREEGTGLYESKGKRTRGEPGLTLLRLQLLLELHTIFINIE